jgi:hypothetical protein
MPATVPDPILDHCIQIIRGAPGPLSIKQIRARLPKAVRFPAAEAKVVAGRLRAFLEQQGDISRTDTPSPPPHVQPWPDAGAQRDLFWNRSFAGAVRDAIPAALAEAPLTLSKLASALRRLVPKSGGARLREELQRQLQALTATGQVTKIGNCFCSQAYFRKMAGAQTSSGAGLSTLVLTAIREMESAPGNYVTLPELRKAPCLQAAIAQAMLQLARAEKVFLAGFGTEPRPEEAADLLELNGELFIGFARNPAVEADS